MKPKVRLLTALVSSLVIIPFALSCGGSSNSDLETSLRSQLSATQAQLDQAQELITNLQDQIESFESTDQTPEPETVIEEAAATEEAEEETPEVSDAEAEATAAVIDPNFILLPEVANHQVEITVIINIAKVAAAPFVAVDTDVRCRKTRACAVVEIEGVLIRNGCR